MSREPETMEHSVLKWDISMKSFPLGIRELWRSKKVFKAKLDGKHQGKKSLLNTEGLMHIQTHTLQNYEWV